MVMPLRPVPSAVSPAKSRASPDLLLSRRRFFCPAPRPVRIRNPACPPLRRTSLRPSRRNPTSCGFCPSAATSTRVGSRRDRRGGPGRPPDNLCRLRLHGRLAACGTSAVDHDASLAAEDGRHADHTDGRRHHPRRRPVRSGRVAKNPHAGADRGEQGRDPEDLLAVPDLRGRRQRRDHGRQRRVADQAQLHRRCCAILGVTSRSTA